MKTKLGIFLSLILTTLLCAAYAWAGDTDKTVIALKTHDFELAETDISDLQVGELESVVTESGKTIDLLRTEDGVEIYIDGELLDMPAMHGEHHDGKMHERVIIECEADEEEACTENMVHFSDGDMDFSELHEAGEGHKVIRIHKSHHVDGEVDVDVEVEHMVEKVIIIDRD